MQTFINKKGVKAAILTMSLIQMATNAIISVIADIAINFSDAPITAIQYLMTFPNLLIVVVGMTAALLSRRISKRTLAVTGLFLCCMSGVLSFFFHDQLMLLFVWAGFLGIGIGCVVPIAMSLISENFQGKEQSDMMGLQTSAANLGSMFMAFTGGVLAAINWNYIYLVYLLAIPGLILTLIYVPKTKIPAQERNIKIKIPVPAWVYFIIAGLFMLLFYLGPTNLSVIITERNIGSAMSAGTAGTILLLGGMLMGILFGTIESKIRKNTIPLGFLVLAVGYVLIYASSGLWILYLGCFISGSSISLVLPQCMIQVISEEHKERNTFMMSVVLAIANLGMFITPVLTTITVLIMKNELAQSRFVFTAVVAILFGLVSLILVHKVRKI